MSEPTGISEGQLTLDGSGEWGKRCLWCDSEATHLCDAPLGHERHDDEVSLRIDGDHWTCDAPICDTHRHIIARICGSAHADTLDVCPEHKDAPPLPLKQWEACSDRSATVRRDAWARAKRKQLRVL